jgi:hypothetical protein
MSFYSDFITDLTQIGEKGVKICFDTPFKYPFSDKVYSLARSSQKGFLSAISKHPLFHYRAKILGSIKSGWSLPCTGSFVAYQIF